MRLWLAGNCRPLQMAGVTGGSLARRTPEVVLKTRAVTRHTHLPVGQFEGPYNIVIHERASKEEATVSCLSHFCGIPLVTRSPPLRVGGTTQRMPQGGEHWWSHGCWSRLASTWVEVLCFCPDSNDTFWMTLLLYLISFSFEYKFHGTAQWAVVKCNSDYIILILLLCPLFFFKALKVLLLLRWPYNLLSKPQDFWE